MKKTIKFEWGTEKQIKISNAGHADSLFYESYRQALAGVAEIVLESNWYTGRGDSLSLAQDRCADRQEDRSCSQQDGCCSKKDMSFFKLAQSEYYPENDKIFYNYPNNMIVFSGERGTGKSSALLTFVDGLKNRDSDLLSEVFLQDMIRCELPGSLADRVRNALKAAHFCSIPPIDPTTLYDRRHHDSHQILTVILSRIYHMAEEAWDRFETGHIRSSGDRQAFINSRNELMKMFSDCYKHINILCGRESSYEEMDELELLDTMGDTVCLKQELANLVEKVLKFCYPKKDNAFLVIQIDDSDMNIEHAYEILEDMRKYLMVPQVIIIMAADLNQLTKLVENSFCENFHSAKDFHELAHNLANQYITKLFPATRQIWLPSLNVYFKEHAEDTKIEYYVVGKRNLPDDSKVYTDNQDQIFRLIFRKTGMIFLKTNGRLHFIIPDNMRLLSHILAMLSQMDNVADPDKEDYGLFAKEEATTEEIHAHIKTLHTRLYNVQRFRDYFVSAWANNTLLPEHVQILSQLDRTSSGNKVNYIFEKLKGNENNGQKLEDVTFASLLGRLDELDKQTSDMALRKYYYAVRQYFSFLGHCLVLQELITYYETAEKDPNKLKEGCTFLALYPVFGSDAFLLFDKTLNSKIGWTLPREAVKRSSKERGGKEDSSDKFVSYLLSMLTEYESQHNGNINRLANLNRSVVNCLYVKKSNPVSENSRKAFGKIGLTIVDKTRLQWERLQSSSLMALTNWDVMRRIRYTAEEAAQDDTKNAREIAADLTDLLSMLSNYYIQLGDKFSGSSQSSGEGKDAYKYPIQCLRSVSFSSWLSPLFYPAIVQDAQETGQFNNLTINIEDTVFNFFGTTKTPEKGNRAVKKEENN